MSWKPFCDTCGEPINNDDDIRYINIIKTIKDGDKKQDKPCMPEREVCVPCAEAVRMFIGTLPLPKEQPEAA